MPANICAERITCAKEKKKNLHVKGELTKGRIIVTFDSWRVFKIHVLQFLELKQAFLPFLFSSRL